MVSITHFVSHFFTPPPKEMPTTGSKKTGPQRVIDYLDSTSGAWNFSRVCELFFSYLKALPFLSETKRLQSEKISGVFALTGSALSLPQLVTDVHSWACSFSALFAATQVPKNDPACQARISHAAKKVLMNTSDLGNTFTQALIFFHDSKIVSLAKYIPILSFFGNSTSLFSDGVECVQEACKVSKYRSKLATGAAPRKVDRLEGKLNLAWMKIAQATSSVAMAVIGLGSLAAGVSMATVPALPAISLGLATVWLTFKVSSYFYEKILDDRRLQVA